MAVNLTDKAPRLSDAELDAMASAGEGQFSKGLRSGALGMGGQVNTLAGEVGIRAGRGYVSADRHAEGAPAGMVTRRS